jgi:hypothetical protein
MKAIQSLASEIAEVKATDSWFPEMMPLSLCLSVRYSLSLSVTLPHLSFTYLSLLSRYFLIIF